jgi:hypothetical protein
MVLFEEHRDKPLTGRIVRIVDDRMIPITDEEALEYLKFSLELSGRKQINDVVIEYHDEHEEVIV